MSKTVKRVSETVKRVMRVMMVGLIAMLGAKAEAHWYVVGGTPKRCSHCVDGELKKDHIKHDAFTHTDVAEFRLTHEKGRLCVPPNRKCITTKITNAKVKDGLHLVVLKQIVAGDATYEAIEIDDNGIIFTAPATFNLVAKFSDSLLKDEPLCPGPALPIDVLIRETALKIVSYWCEGKINVMV